mmetsp:Transcript_9698/g.19342  ORF Transcript_9698/g.19342 Transcript_9698/m.19342 type:complete len:241 (-) Transcript_9698:1898-2620(-)
MLGSVTPSSSSIILKSTFSSSGATTETEERRSSSFGSDSSITSPPFWMTTASSSNSKSSSYFSSSSPGGGGGGGSSAGGGASADCAFFFLVQTLSATGSGVLCFSTVLIVFAHPGTCSALSSLLGVVETAALAFSAAARTFSFSANLSSMALVISGLSLHTKMQPSPPTLISLLLSRVNLTPVTSSECPATLPISSPDMKSKSLTHLSIPAVATTSPERSTSSLKMSPPSPPYFLLIFPF